jgi:protoheme IX farnesyltransferase
VNPVESHPIAAGAEVSAQTFSYASVRDLLDLAKPRITSMVVFTTAMGLWLAPGAIGAARTVALLAGTALLVGSANILNCWYERETDGLMLRTRNRPLPAGRLDPATALALGIGCGVVAIPILTLMVNPLTALLGAIAHMTYVLVYTPLKKISPWALEIGAIPGAIPPLMGWTASTGALTLPGWFLFGILFFWQIPHFLAIAIYLEDDYRRGGLKVLSVTRGSVSAARWLAVYTVALIVVSLLAQPLQLAGMAYTVTAALLGFGFLAFARRGVTGPVEGAWARRTMLYSIAWLTALMFALVAFAR